MSNPQQPELARSRKTPTQDPDAAASVIEGQRDVGQSEPGGPVPPENQPGHHPPQEQDKPNLDAFAQRFGVTEGEEAGPDGARPAAGLAERTLAGVASAKGGMFAIGVAAMSALAVALGVLLNRKRRRGRGE